MQNDTLGLSGMLGLYGADFLLVPHPEGRLAVAISADLRNLKSKFKISISTMDGESGGPGPKGQWDQQEKFWVLLEIFADNGVTHL